MHTFVSHFVLFVCQTITDVIGNWLFEIQHCQWKGCVMQVSSLLEELLILLQRIGRDMLRCDQFVNKCHSNVQMHRGDF